MMMVVSDGKSGSLRQTFSLQNVGTNTVLHFAGRDANATSAGRRMDGCTYGRTDGRTDGWMDGRMDGWIDGRMDGRTDGWMDGLRKRKE